MKKIIFLCSLFIFISINTFGQRTEKDSISNVSWKKTLEDLDQKPEFPGGNSALFNYLKDNIKYPADAVEEKLEGRVILTFIVNREGKIVNAKVKKSVSPSCDKEALRIVRSMPDWIPGMKDGKAVTVQYTLPVTFKLRKESKKQEQLESNIPKDEIVHRVQDQLPEFPGGSYALSAYLARNIKYPADAVKEKIEGKVVVSFVITEEGKIIDAKVIEGIRRDCDIEALRVVKKMPDWKPCICNGEKIRTQYKVSVNFKLPQEYE